MNRITLKLLAAALLLAGAQQAFAQVHTGAGTEIGNTANVDYKVSGIDQTTESDTAAFVVDRLVNVTVTTTDTAEIGVVPDSNLVVNDDGVAATPKLLRFQVNNQTNSAIGVTLDADNAADTTANPWPPGGGEADSFNVGEGDGSFRMYLDAGVLGTFEPGTDTLITTGIASIAQEGSAYVWVVADIPAIVAGAPANGDVAVVSLQATAVEPTSLAAIDYLTSDDANTANAEFAFDSIAGDATPGVVAGEVPYDGVDSAYSAYEISSAQITVTKSSFVLSDPVNGTTNPKAIPGAIVLYCIEVANDGSVEATDVTINDNIPVGTTYYDDEDAGTIRIIAPDTESLTCNAAAAVLGVLQDDGDAFDGGTGNGVVSTTVSALDTGEKTSTVFQVTID